MLYKGSTKSPQQIGEELGVSYLLTGRVAWDKSDTASELRITTELVRVSDGASVWTDSYQRVLDHIFDMQADIARSVTRELKIAMRESYRRELSRVPTDNLLAYDYYLRGNEYFNRSWDREDVQIATQLYQQAVDLDPEFALAYAALARGHASMYWEYYDRSEERREMAVQEASRALRLDPDLVEGHLAMGYCHYHCFRGYERALSEFERALEIEPNNADLYNAIAAVKRRQSDLEGALDNFLMALELDPRSHLKTFDIGLTYGMMRKYKEADEYLERTIALAPDVSLPYVFRAWLQILQSGDVKSARQIVAGAAGKADLTTSKFYWWLERLIESDHQKTLSRIRPGSDTAAYQLQRAQIYRLMDRREAMLACADTARIILEGNLRRLPEDAVYHSSLGLAYAYLGKHQQALSSGQKALDLLPTTREAFDAPFLVLNMAEILLVCERYDLATKQLGYLLSIPGFTSPYYLELDPLWDPLRDRDDFRRLIREAT
jgi:tetratricopeptide (TPR) repeat protein